MNDRTEQAIALRRLEERYLTLRTVVRAVCVIGVAYFAFEALKSAAGKSTVVDVAVHALVKFEVVSAIVLAGSMAAWAAVERILRLRKVEQMQGRIRELETKIDPKRSSSGLTPRGKTNPKDIRRR